MNPPGFTLRWRRPLVLYLLTWLTTTGVGYLFFSNGSIARALMFSGSLMLILSLHELGHYLQIRRYGVRSSLPFFVPLPLPPFGTLGAVIAMGGEIPNRKALFDIGISGPLAGLVPTLCCCYGGLCLSRLVPSAPQPDAWVWIFEEPLLLQWMAAWVFGPIPPDMTVLIHPIGIAGWAGLFLTSINLIPLGQLDGGHVFYALFGRYAGYFTRILFLILIILVVVYSLWHWALMIVLLAAIGVVHPPTLDDTVPIGPFRRVLGGAILAFVLIAFTPDPLRVQEPAPAPSADTAASFVEDRAPPKS